MNTKISRREFLVLTQMAGAGLVLGWGREATAAGAEFKPNAFLKIDPAGNVTIWAPKPDMGEGTFTSLPMIIAEELGVEWPKVTIVQADFDSEYGDQMIGGSMSIRTSYERLRQAGATGREMLIAAAAQRWGVAASACRAENGAVLHDASKRRLPYGELADAAAKLPVPKQVKLKDPKTFNIIGKPLHRKDTPAKVNGTAVFGIDVKVPGMLYAVIARPTVFGAEIESVDDSKAKAVPGVKRIVRIPRTNLINPMTTFGGTPQLSGAGHLNYVPAGVAVVADSTWAAMKGRDALVIKWKNGAGSSISSAALRAEMQQLADKKPSRSVRNDGNVDQALAGAAKKVEAVYEVPFVAHAAMEPLNATAHVKGNTCELWAPIQHPAGTAISLAAALAIPQDKIKIHLPLLGGGFGRKFHSDFSVEAALVSKAAGAPVKLVWTREDDTKHDYFRPASYHKLVAGLDPKGTPVAWRHHVISTPISTTLNGTGDPKPEAFEIPQPDFPAYAIPNFRVDYTAVNTLVPRGFWRSVEGSINGFVVQSFFDEVAAAAGKDPVALRLEILKDKGKLEGIDYTRFKKVIELAASKGAWGTPLPKGQGRGFAVFYSFQTYVAQVAEVTVPADGNVRVNRIVCAVDCGTVVNPNSLAGQVEGAVNFALSQTLLSEITIKDGMVEQGNFDSYRVLRMNQAPPVEIHIVPSTEPPTGMGEPAVPPLAAAVANAIFAATGKRIRRLPIRPGDLAAKS